MIAALIVLLVGVVLIVRYRPVDDSTGGTSVATETPEEPPSAQPDAPPASSGVRRSARGSSRRPRQAEARTATAQPVEAEAGLPSQASARAQHWSPEPTALSEKIGDFLRLVSPPRPTPPASEDKAPEQPTSEQPTSEEPTSEQPTKNGASQPRRSRSTAASKRRPATPRHPR